MASFNRVVLLGNLTRDPQLKYLPSQTPVVEFGLAMNRRYSTGGEQREETTFVDCAAFGKQAEVINQYCQKGKALLVEGRLKYDQWEDKQGGGKRSRLTVVVENFQFVGGRDGGGGGGGGGGDYQQRPPQRQPAQQQRPQPDQEPAPFGDEPQFREDDIPF